MTVIGRPYFKFAPSIIGCGADLYELALQSRKPEAKTFRKWVTAVVLPTFRKDGAYIKGEEKPEQTEDQLIATAFEALMRKCQRSRSSGPRDE